jgi:hypothetical protein
MKTHIISLKVLAHELQASDMLTYEEQWMKHSTGPVAVFPSLTVGLISGHVISYVPKSVSAFGGVPEATSVPWNFPVSLTDK